SARGSWPRLRGPETGRTTLVAAGAAAVAAPAARLLPTNDLPLAIGAYVIGLTGVAGAAILGYHRGRGPTFPIPAPTPAVHRARLALATPVLIGYAAAAIAVPLQLGLTHAIPVGPRWWLLAIVWAGFALLA